MLVARIQEQTPVNASDILRARVIEILGVELANQNSLRVDNDFELTTHIERFKPFNPEDMDCLNIRFVNDLWQSGSTQSTEGKLTFFIEYYTANESTDDICGDQTGALKVSKVLGACKSILRFSDYLYLAFEKRIVARSIPRSIEVSDWQDNHDANNIMYGRLTLEVDASDCVNLVTPLELENIKNIIKLHETEKGYVWQLKEE